MISAVGRGRFSCKQYRIWRGLQIADILRKVVRHPFASRRIIEEHHNTIFTTHDNLAQGIVPDF